MQINNILKSADAGFFELLFSANNIDHSVIKEIVFHRGMLFRSFEMWWDNNGKRQKPHEGIDILFFREKSGAMLKLDKGWNVPAAQDGLITAVIDDLIGKSVFVAHDIYNDSLRLYSVYAHINPKEGAAEGDILERGAILGSISGTLHRKSRILPHLHLTFAWMRQDLSKEEYDWNTIGTNDKVRLIDPLDFFDFPCSEVNPRSR